MESNFDLNNGAKDFKQLADALCCFELDRLVFLRQARLNVLDESLCRPLVKRSVVQQRLLSVPDKLALGDGCINLGLSQLEEELEARHLIVLLKLEENEKGLVLDIAVFGGHEFLLELSDGSLNHIDG